MSIAVSIVEDDAQVRASLGKLIDGAPGYRCVSQHSSAENALTEIPKFKPDVTLMDINLPGLNGVECVRRLSQRGFGGPWLALVGLFARTLLRAARSELRDLRHLLTICCGPTNYNRKAALHYAYSSGERSDYIRKFRGRAGSGRRGRVN